MQSEIARELVRLEKRYWLALQDKDPETAVSLSDDPCLVVGAQGVGEIDNRAMADLVEGADYNLDHFEFDNVTVRPLTDDVAIVAYKVSEELVVDGKPVNLEAYDSSVWIRRNGKWLCSLHTESIAGDPFGRR